MVDEDERKQKIEMVVLWRNQGKSISEAARLVDSNRATISRWLNEAGQGGTQHKAEVVYTLADKKSIITKWAQLIASGVPRVKAAESVGVTPKMLNRWLGSEPSLRVEYNVLRSKGHNIHTGRKSFEAILTEIRAGQAVWREGARYKLQMVEGALMRYELDGASVWRCIGFATLSGTDVLARDWMVVTNEV